MGWRGGDVSRTRLSSKCLTSSHERYRWAIAWRSVHGRLGRAAIPPALVRLLHEWWPRFVRASGDGRCAAMAAARARPSRLVGSRLPHNLAIEAHDIAEVFWRSSMLGESPRPPTLARAAPGEEQDQAPRSGRRQTRQSPAYDCGLYASSCESAPGIGGRRRGGAAPGEGLIDMRGVGSAARVTLLLRHAWRWFCSTRGVASEARVALLLKHAWRCFCNTRGVGSAARAALVLQHARRWFCSTRGVGPAGSRGVLRSKKRGRVSELARAMRRLSSGRVRTMTAMKWPTIPVISKP